MDEAAYFVNALTHRFGNARDNAELAKLRGERHRIRPFLAQAALAAAILESYYREQENAEETERWKLRARRYAVMAFKKKSQIAEKIGTMMP